MDAELTVHDVIEADGDMAEQITAGVAEAQGAVNGCDELYRRLEALQTRVVDLRVPGALEGMLVRLMEQTAAVRSSAAAIAERLPAASETIATAGGNAEARHQPLADAVRDAGHARPAQRDYHNDDGGLIGTPHAAIADPAGPHLMSGRGNSGPPVPDYDAEVAVIRTMLADAPCPTCGRGLSEHTFFTDEAGHAHCSCHLVDGETPTPYAWPSPATVDSAGRPVPDYYAEVAAIRTMLADAPCPTCQRGASDHTFLPDEAGHAHSSCHFVDGETPTPYATAPDTPSEDAAGNIGQAAEQAAPIEYRMSDAPLLENTWGGFAENPVVNYHGDGEIGLAIERMGPDARLDVDGDALANVVGRIATDAVVGRTTSQEALDRLKLICDRLPESDAKRHLAYAVNQLDAPATPAPNVPDGTPPALRQLVTDLHAVPLVRRDPSKEEQPLMDLINDVAQGRNGGIRLQRQLRSLQNRRHESKEGKFEIDRAINRAVDTLEADRRRRRQER